MTASSASRDSRHMVYSDEKSHKFWKLELDGSTHTVNFGRIGTAGQTQTKVFDSEAAARVAFDKLVVEKTKKGYVDDAGAAGPSATGAGTVAKPATAKSASTTKAPGKARRSAPAKPDAVSAPKSVKETSGDEAAADSTEPEAQNVDLKAASIPKDSINVDFSVDRWIQLPEKSLYFATFKPRPPLQRGVPAPFDQARCIQQIEELRTGYRNDLIQWYRLKLPSALSREESEFWFRAMTITRNYSKVEKFIKSLEKVPIEGKLTLAEAGKLVGKSEDDLNDDASMALANLISAEEYFQLLIDKPFALRHNWKHEESTIWRIDGFIEHVVPYLSDSQRESFRQQIRQNWNPHLAPSSKNAPFPAEYCVAAAIGMPDEIEEVVSHWPDNHFAGYLPSWFWAHSRSPNLIVNGLGSPERIVAESKRLKLPMNTVSHIHAFLACTEYSALDWVAGDILSRGFPSYRNFDYEMALALAHAPETAVAMLRLKLAPYKSTVARDWLDKHVGCAVTGLLDVAEEQGELADAALEYLKSVKRRGYESVIREAMQRQGRSGGTRVQTEVLNPEEPKYAAFDSRSTPKWLQKELDQARELKIKPVPDWCTGSQLPPLVVGDRRLNDEQIATVVRALMATPVTGQHSLLTALREQATLQSRDEFAWKLYKMWEFDWFSAREKWVMGAFAHLGGDGTIRKLTPLIRAWPGESQHARAVVGLECLRKIGSNEALMQLSGIAQKLKFKALKAKAEQFVAEIASERGMTREELEDRVIPDCGLDEKGGRKFSFGSRSFSFVLGGDLKPMLRDEAGKIRPNLPAPGAKDDAELAAASIAEWKLLKKQIKDVAAIQATRLEQAMIVSRRWGLDDFKVLVAQHPLMTHLAQKLVWGGYDKNGKLVTTLRVTEERDLADSEDKPAQLKQVTTVGIVHPLELAAEELECWGQVFGDYEIAPPFLQLGRPVYSLEPGEEKAETINRYRGLSLPAPTLVYTLEKLGWSRGMVVDNGAFDEHSKYFPAADFTAVICYEGCASVGYIVPEEFLETTEICFCPGRRAPSAYEEGLSKKVKLKTVPPIVISEVLADLQFLKSKVK